MEADNQRERQVSRSLWSNANYLENKEERPPIVSDPEAMEFAYQIIWYLPKQRRCDNERRNFGDSGQQER